LTSSQPQPQQQPQDLSWTSAQQQPQQQPQDLSWTSSQQQPQDLSSWATLQQKPWIRTFGGYGQQQQQPLIRNFGGYGQQQQQQDVQSIIPQVLIRKFGGYGQQQQQLDLPVRISRIKFISLLTFICRKCPSKQAVVMDNKLNPLPMMYLK
jgi:hypothetical protein